MILTDTDISRCIDFHGHSCPGLAIGMRAAEYCLNEFGHNDEMDMVAICETDMCGVDGIQVLTGCTFGKGNLIHRDYGKMAFTFHSRKTGEGKRILFNRDAGEGFKIMREAMDDPASTPELISQLRERFQKDVMTMTIEDLFTVMDPREPMPRPAAILNTLHCEDCGDPIMESRARMFAGKTLCIPCFGEVEQKK